jgi:hypothetical protein
MKQIQHHLKEPELANTITTQRRLGNLRCAKDTDAP